MYDTVEDMDIGILNLASKLVVSNPDSMRELKQVMWLGSENWDELLTDRAKISGERVLSDFTRKTIQKLKNE